MTTPLRIASLLPSATEIMYAIGLGEQVVGRSHECRRPEEVLTQPCLTRSHVDSSRPSGDIDTQVKTLVAESRALYSVDVEALVRARPNVIVTQDQCDVCAVRYSDVLDAVATQPELAASQVVALNPQSLEDVLADIVRIGEATGAENEAAQFIADLNARIGHVEQTVGASDDTARPRVAIIEWVEPMMLAGNWTPRLLERAGGQCSLTTAGQHSEYVDWNEVVDFAPEVIVVAPCGFDLPRTLLEARPLAQLPGWRQLPAVRTQRVFAVDGDAYFNCASPRLVDSLELLAHLIHPERIGPPNSLAQDIDWVELRV